MWQYAEDCSRPRGFALQADDEDGQELCDKLGVEVLPTLQFYREGKKLWEHRGHQAMEPAMGEGGPLWLLWCQLLVMFVLHVLRTRVADGQGICFA